MRLLLVEDEEGIGRFICQGLREAGHTVDWSKDGVEGLEYLMRNAGQVLTRTQIGEHVWGFDFYNESNVVDVYIGYLRRKIDRGKIPPLIETMRGTGYRLSSDED